MSPLPAQRRADRNRALHEFGRYKHCSLPGRVIPEADGLERRKGTLSQAFQLVAMESWLRS
jgi:hypothetical protein